MLIWLSPTVKQMDLGHSCYYELSFSRRFPIPGRPAVVSLGTKKVKQSWVSGSRTPSGGAINFLLKAGSSNRSVDAEILEKEFKFNPSFDEYLKAMESVRTVREKKQKHSSKIDNSKNAERSQLGDFDGHTQKGNVGGRIDSKERVGTKLKDAKEMGSEEVGNTGRAPNLVREELEEKECKNNVICNKKFDVGTKNGGWEKKQSNSVQERERNGAVEGQNFKSNKDSLKGTQTGIGLERISTQVEAGPCEKLAAENVKLRKSNKFIAKDSIDGEVEWERAAFKSLGDFGDVVDKPRASRNELEERIQKLARW